jgi:hypothetical protein
LAANVDRYQLAAVRLVFRSGLLQGSEFGIGAKSVNRGLELLGYLLGFDFLSSHLTGAEFAHALDLVGAHNLVVDIPLDAVQNRLRELVGFGAVIENDVELDIASDAENPSDSAHSLRALLSMNGVNDAVASSVEAAVNTLPYLNHEVSFSRKDASKYKGPQNESAGLFQVLYFSSGYYFNSLASQ